MDGKCFRASAQHAFVTAVYLAAVEAGHIKLWQEHFCILSSKAKFENKAHFKNAQKFLLRPDIIVK